MPIPRIIHQTWKTQEIPPRWRNAIASVKHYHPGWEYRFWTDEDMETHVRDHHPDFYPVFMAFSRPIMRADAFRYVLMHDFGGLYCDLDYQFIRPYDYSGAEVVLAEEFSRDFGDGTDCLANYIFASAPGHRFWADLIESLRTDPPTIRSFDDIVPATGPIFLDRIYRQNAARYEGVRIENKLVFSPVRLHGRGEKTILLNNGVTRGIHLGSGSWKERWSWTYLKAKPGKIAAKVRRRFAS